MRIEDAIKLKQNTYQKEQPEKSSTQSTEVLAQLKTAVKQVILEAFREDQNLFTNEPKIRTMVRKQVDYATEGDYSHLLLSVDEKQAIIEDLIQALTGFGVIDPFLKDPCITEIMINGKDNIFIEKNGRLTRALSENGIPLVFEQEKDLLNLIEKIVAPINRKIDESDPIVDARLPDGSRVNAVIRPISLEGPIITIRKFPENPYTMDQLISLGALTHEVAEWLETLVKARYNIVVSGGTGSGKTTFLNALSMFVPARERIITVEDAAELKVNHIENLVRLETRSPNMENKGAISIRDLVRTALRMRPDRIIVGEVRGGEALDMLQAMNTGHDGSLTTGHANSSHDMLSRLETMVLMSGLELPLPAIRRQIASAVEFIVQLGRMRDGSRKVIQISEVKGVSNGEVECTDLFKWKTYGTYADGSIKGSLEPVATSIVQTEKWDSLGVSQPINHFLLLEHGVKL
ncbi:CpaF family protein [Halalkalibacter alkalisediminis]|uniref:CpaF family protein n=1 Tax=Halalkalibacter alkalisediminis TaxID=935616 RepID=A0ABV6NKG6_9BACI|nr:CpaF family protein [Halalkalibacter alkalisediminis]